MKLVNLESAVKSNQLTTTAQSLSEKTSSTKVPTSQNSLETKIKAITQNGSLTTLVISADEFTEYASILAKISGKYTLSVSGVQASNVSYVLSNKYVSSITVSDSIKNITSNLSVLISNLTKITSITETGQISQVALTAAQYSSVLTSKFTNFTATVSSVLANNAVTILADTKVSFITITDSSANIAAILDILQPKITKITSITQSGNVSALAITATQLTNDASVLAKISGIYTLSVSGVLASNVTSVLSNTHVSSIGISDTAKNISTSLTSLISNLAKINAITETGTISSIVLTTSQYSSALTAKFSNFTATVSGVLAAKVASIATDTKVESMTVVDTSANIAASLDSLKTSIAKITFISQNGSSEALAITASQLNNDAIVLAKITGMYTLKISDSLAANVPNLVNNMHVISISIADTAVNISAYLVSLVGVSNKITAISVLDSSPIVLTESQLHSSVGTLALIQGAYTLTVTNVAAKNLIDVLSNPHVTSVSITDTAANISTYLDSIQILSNQIANITLVDNAPIAVSESQLTSDAKALLLLQPSYSLTVNSVAAGDLATIFTNTHVSSISISDTASNVATNLDKIQANLLAGKSITGITVTDNNLIHITEFQLTSDVDALGLILGSYSLDVTNATAGNLGNIFNNSHVTSVSITDSTANIAANLDAIEADLIAGKPITSISANDINDISLTQSQLTSDAGALALLSGSYSLAINNALAAVVLKISTNSHISSIVISDTTSNINDNLDNIQNAINLGTHIKSIQVADQPNIVDFLLAPNAAVGSSDFGQYISISGISGAPVISDQTYSSGSANSVYFNGTSQLNIVDPNLNLGTSNYQISFEMKTDGPQTPYSTFMSAGGVWFANCPAYGNYLRFVDGSVDAWGKGNINDGVWHTVLASQINGVASFYIDGNLEVSAINGVSGTNPSVNFYTAQMVLGHLQGQWAGNWDNSYRGWIDDFKIATLPVTKTLSITESQLNSDAGALALISGSYNLAVTDVQAGDINSVLTNTHVSSIAISDTASNVATNLDKIQANLLAGISITGITITDNSPIILTESQLIKDADALALISGDYRLAVTDVPIADLLTVQNQGQSHLSAYSISISDSVANIVANLGTLANNFGIVKSITPTDPTTPMSLTSTQLNQYSNVVPKLAGDYHLEISGNVSDFRSQAYTLWNLRHPISFAITDSAENLSANLLNFFWGVVISQANPVITLTDPNVPIHITGDQMNWQTYALYYISGDYRVNVTDILANQAFQWLSSPNPHVVSIAISDNATQITQCLDQLSYYDRHDHKIVSVQVTDGQPISINTNQLINESNILNTFNNKNGNFLAITDSSDQIASNLDVLQANISKISSITQSGIATPLAITAAQLTNDADALAKLTGNYTLKVSDVLAANVSGLLNNSHVTSISITDTAANILANLDSLELVNSKITSITLSDNTPMTLTVAKLTADHDVIAKITNSGAITILDTAINIDTNIAYLHSLGSQITSISIAEKVPTIDWVHQFGLSSTSNSSIVWGLASSGNANGDLFVAGYSWDYANYPASNTTYLSKVDANGNTLWTENLGSSQSIGAEGSVISDIAGNVYIETMGTSGPYLEKLSTNGEMIWKTSQPNLQTNYLTAQVFNALSLDSGYIYAIGDTYNGLSSIANKGGLDGYLAKYDPLTGAAIWETLVGSSANDQLQSVTTDVLGNVYVSGTTFGNVAAVNSGGSDGFVAKYSSNGELIWDKQIPSALNTPWGGDRGNAQVLVDGQENVYITGNTTTSVNGQPYSGGTAIYLIKLDANGNTLWTKEFGSGWETFIQSMAFTASGNIVMTGFAYGSLNGQPYQGGYGDWVSIEYGVNGTLGWTKEMGTSSNEASMAIATNSSGKIYIGGYSEGDFYSLNPTHTQIGSVVALGGPNLELTAQEVSNNSDVLNKIVSGYTVSISDTATHVSDNLDALKTVSDHISHIDFSGINSVVMTAPQTFDGANANTAFNLTPNALGTPSSSNFATINNWQVGDVIQYSSFLKVIGNSGPSSTGLASINAQTGLVTFDPADKTSLQDEIAAVESAIAAAGTTGAGHFAKWDRGGDTYVLVTDNHLGSAASAGDDLVKLVGVDSYHVQLLAGGVVAH